MSGVRLIPFVLEEVLQNPEQEIPYGVQMINAPEMWKNGEKGTGVVIAVLDTGCDLEHPDLKDRIIGGRSFVGDDPDDFADGHFHGTHVCGTIAATLDKQGVVGVAPEVKLLILRVLDKNGSGSYEGITEAIQYATKWKGPNGERVRIISMSLGGPDDVPELHKAIQEAVQNEILVVCAAGNEGDNDDRTDEKSYPGYYKEVVEVGAVDEKKKLAEFSNTNDEIDLVAPGVNVISCYPGGKYAKLSGTSMATPHVSGAAAVLITKEEKEFGRELTEAEVYAQLCKNTQPIDASKRAAGNGLLYLQSSNQDGSKVPKEEKVFIKK
ncbi:S8 family peptidase [Fictibacillus sp. Mic-4]|uniref:S8 family peptidase n=1 Tax=Fictibacillus TaxID=1329200 RepID=UPI0004113FE4|nr:S8 family peptidase [Fictibacillus gelatini]